MIQPVELTSLAAGLGAATVQHVPAPVLGAGLAMGNSVLGGPDGVWFPIALVILLLAATLPPDRVLAALRATPARR